MRFKRITSVILSMIIALGLFVPAFAAVSYSFDETTGTLTITGSGAVTEADVSAAVNNDKSLIKKVAFGSGTTSIGDHAFEGCSGLTEISLPSGLDSIGSSAFYDCVSLESINIPSGVTSIADDTFSGCTKLESVIMPGVERIGKRAFNGCSALESIELPNGLESIGAHAFYNCSGLISAVIPPTIRYTVSSIDSQKNSYSIGDYAFAACTELVSVFVPALPDTDYSYEQRRIFPENTIMLVYSLSGPYVNITEATGNTAAECIDIPGRILSWNLRSVSAGVFSSYNNLTTAFIPDITADNAFHPSTAVFVNGGESVRGNLNGTVITIPVNTLSIADGAFTGLENLRKINVEKGNPAFISVDGVLYSKDAQGNPGVLICYPPQKTNLDIFTVPDSVTAINTLAFYSCYILKEIEIPSGVSSIGSRAFEKCSSLKAITVSPGNNNFVSVDGVLYKADANGNSEELVYYPQKKTGDTFEIPAGVTAISDYAFEDCKNLKTVVIPSGVTSIGNSVFEGTGIKQVTIPDSVTIIGDSAFAGLMNVIYSDNMTASGSPWGAKYANRYYEAPFVFEDEQKQEVIYCDPDAAAVTIPVSVSTIDSGAFTECTGLTHIFLPAGFTNSGTGTGTAGGDEPGTGTGTSTGITPVDPGTGTGTPATGTVTVFGVIFPESANIWRYETCADQSAAPEGKTLVSITGTDYGSGRILACDGMGDGFRIESVAVEGIELYHVTGCPEYTGSLEIDTYEKLKFFASRVNSGETGLNAVLTADITAEGSWEPVGYYMGTFNGAGHTITDIYIFDYGEEDYDGFFRVIGGNGTVKNVSLCDGYVKGDHYVGGIAGANEGTIINCSYAGSIVTGNSQVGGIAGTNGGVIENCSNSANIKNFVFHPGDTNTGGLAGGITSENTKTGMVINCFNTGGIGVYKIVGGIASFNRGLIANCYNTGNICGSTTIGGLVDTNGGTVKNCYNTGKVSGTATPHYKGTIVHQNIGNVENCYYDIDIAGNIDAIESESDYATSANVAGLTTEQMTGADALDYMVFAYEDGETNPWMVRAGTTGLAFYPHLTGFNFKADGTPETDPSQIPPEDWPAKIEKPFVSAFSLTLDGDIGVNFYADIPGVTDEAYATFTVDGKTYEVPVDFNEYIIKDGKTLYRFTFDVAAAQIDTPITVVISNRASDSEPFDYSVQDYLTEAQATMADDELFMALAGSLATYGLYANELFGFNPDFTRHPLFDDSEFDGINAESLSEYESLISDLEGGVTYAGSSLVLRTETAIRHYFTLPEGKTVDDFVFKLGDEILTPKTGKNGMYVEISDIPSAKLGNPLTVTVFDGDNNVVNSWTYSAMTYVYNVLSKAEAGEPEITAELVNVCKALTLYCYAAKEYFIGQEITFLLTDNLNWQEGYVYARDANGKTLTGEYPGTLAETTVNEYGETVFIVRLPAGTAGCIVSDGHGHRTVEITDFSYTGYWMDGSTDNDGNFRVIGWN